MSTTPRSIPSWLKLVCLLLGLALLGAALLEIVTYTIPAAEKLWQQGHVKGSTLSSAFAKLPMKERANLLAAAIRDALFLLFGFLSLRFSARNPDRENASMPGILKWICWIVGGWIAFVPAAHLIVMGIAGWILWQVAKEKNESLLVHASTQALTVLAATVLVDLLVMFAGIWLMKLPGRKKGGSSLVAEATAVQNLQPQSQTVLPELAPKPHKRARAKRWASANVMALGADSRRIWNFNSGKNGFSVAHQATVPSAQPLPAKMVGRDWRTLLQPKLNVAWLPVEQVFLRVAHLPVSNFEETLSMVELQLEKLSPLPVTQIVWSMQALPQIVDNLQTVIVIIVARDIVEKFLGELEGQGFLADRLELPILDELLATRITHDGAYIYPDNSTGKFSALVAWWYGGTLRNLSLLHVPAVDNRDAILKDQLSQMTWSGELEGWLTGAPRWTLVADDIAAANWQPMFRPWLGQSVEVLTPLSEADLATRNANRAGRGQSGNGILPAEYTLRYAQEFHDRLWMRGLGAVFVVYIIGVTVYMLGSMFVGIQADDAEKDMRNLAREYTNTLQIKAQVDILQNRQALKFASLDCWKTTAELLPAGITLGSMDFKDGKTLGLSGTAPGDGNGSLTDFNEAMRKATLNGQQMFERVDLPNVRLNPGGATLSWSFSAVLANAEEIQ